MGVAAQLGSSMGTIILILVLTVVAVEGEVAALEATTSTVPPLQTSLSSLSHSSMHHTEYSEGYCIHVATRTCSYSYMQLLVHVATRTCSYSYMQLLVHVATRTCSYSYM